jgi:hypothetical protein
MFSPAAAESGPDGLDFYGLRRKLSRGIQASITRWGGVSRKISIPEFGDYPARGGSPLAEPGDVRRPLFPEARGFGTCCSSKESVGQRSSPIFRARCYFHHGSHERLRQWDVTSMRSAWLRLFLLLERLRPNGGTRHPLAEQRNEAFVLQLSPGKV